VNRDIPAIDARGLSKRFGEVEALVDVTLSVSAGNILALLGPNGAGKTTFVRIMTTLLSPDRGEAFIVGHSVFREPATVRSLLGLAGQYPAVDEILTGRENLQMVGRLYHMGRSEARHRADELLEQFKLRDAANNTVKTYSGGMRRRLDLAASIVNKPSVLFLDEPTTGLDPRSRLALWEMIAGLVREGTTVLLSTQYLEEADHLADVVAVLDYGKIIRQGTPSELKFCCGGGSLLNIQVADRPKRLAAERILRDLADGNLKINHDTGYISLPISSSAMLPEVIRRLDSENVPIADFSIKQPTLDDVFLALTGRTVEDTDAAHIKQVQRM